MTVLHCQNLTDVYYGRQIFVGDHGASAHRFGVVGFCPVVTVFIRPPPCKNSRPDIRVAGKWRDAGPRYSDRATIQFDLISRGCSAWNSNELSPANPSSHLTGRGGRISVLVLFTCSKIISAGAIQIPTAPVINHSRIDAARDRGRFLA